MVFKLGKNHVIIIALKSLNNSYIVEAFFM
jgi:hypothetical protein